jgi:hypothetical protein
VPKTREQHQADFLAYLESLPDQDETVISCACGEHSYSPASLAHAVREGTEDGVEWLDMYIRAEEYREQSPDE